MTHVHIITLSPVDLEPKPLRQRHLGAGLTNEPGMHAAASRECLELGLIPAPGCRWEDGSHPSDWDNIFLMPCSGWLLFCWVVAMHLRLREGNRLSRGNNIGKKSPNHCSGCFLCHEQTHESALVYREAQGQDFAGYPQRWFVYWTC